MTSVKTRRRRPVYFLVLGYTVCALSRLITAMTAEMNQVELVIILSWRTSSIVFLAPAP